MRKAKKTRVFVFHAFYMRDDDAEHVPRPPTSIHTRTQSVTAPAPAHFPLSQCVSNWFIMINILPSPSPTHIPSPNAN